MIRVLPPVLLVVHGALFIWAFVGMAEWLIAEVPWPTVSNLAFPPWLLLLHWLAILGGSVVFVVGYLTRWRQTPSAMVAAYALMAAVCFIETFWFLTGTARFVAMGMELATYVGIVLLLRKLPAFVQRFASAHG